MKRIILIFSISFVFAGFGVLAFLSPLAEAQTKPADRSRQAAPSPTATPPQIVSSPSPTPRFNDDAPIKIDTELVNINVRVVDRNNRPMNNVQQKEFKVY